MKTKVIKLHYMINGISTTYMDNGEILTEPCKSIQAQMKEILEQNKNYKFVDLIYHNSNSINTKEASLIVEIIENESLEKLKQKLIDLTTEYVELESRNNTIGRDLEDRINKLKETIVIIEGNKT